MSEKILCFVGALIVLINFVGSLGMYMGGLSNELEYRGYDYPNPLSVRCIFIYWLDLISELSINMFGKVILITLMTIIFSPIVVIHFVATLIGFIGLYICKLFLYVFRENKDKKIEREAKRELKKLDKQSKLRELQ